MPPKKRQICFDVESPDDRVALLRYRARQLAKKRRKTHPPTQKEKKELGSYFLTPEGIRTTHLDEDEPGYHAFESKRNALGLRKPRHLDNEREFFQHQHDIAEAKKKFGPPEYSHPIGPKKPTIAKRKKLRIIPSIPLGPSPFSVMPESKRSGPATAPKPVKKEIMDLLNRQGEARVKQAQHPPPPLPERKHKPPVEKKSGSGIVHKPSGEPDEKKSQRGAGTTYDTQIDKVMEKVPGYLGTYAIDTLHDAPFSTRDDTCLVLNSDKSRGPGVHWVGIWMSPTKDKSVELFDSLAGESPLDKKRVVDILKRKVDAMKLPYRLKLKINTNRLQRANSSNCGIFACHFLLDRARGKSFADATHYGGIQAAEGAMKPLEEQFKYL